MHISALPLKTLLLIKQHAPATRLGVSQFKFLRERISFFGWLGADVHPGSHQLWPDDGVVKTKRGCQVLPGAHKGHIREVPSSGITESCHTPSAGASCFTLSPVPFLP